ncbi:MAG: radical SAM protein [Elusimicrobiota bacterium]|nr:radical SAM protein [Elusimicrobiota bacterium]
MKQEPAYLFKKLGRSIGVSTGTGDFYELPTGVFNSLKKWNYEIKKRNGKVSAAAAEKLARRLSIPAEISALFPLRTTKPEVPEASARLTDLTLNITSDCNLRCIYCWNDTGKYSNEGFEKKKTAPGAEADCLPPMSVETAARAVDLLVEMSQGEKQLVVDFYGGEPLKNLPALLGTVEYCKALEKKKKIRFHFLLATNGTLLTPELAEKLLGFGVQIAVSVDGPGRIHDRNRPFHDGKGSFAAIAENLGKMRPATRRRLVGRTTVTPYYTDMVALYNNLKSMGFERVEIFETEDACHRITPERESVFFQKEQDFRRMFREYELLAGKYSEEAVSGALDYGKTFFNRFFKLMQRLYYNNQVIGGCPAAQGQIAVSSDGEIFPCTSFIGIKAFSLGNVRSGVNREKYLSLLKKTEKRFRECASCRIFSVCGTTGSCLNINHYFNGDISRPHARSCRLFEEKIKLAMAVLAILSEKMPDRLEALFGCDPVGRRGNELY